MMCQKFEVTSNASKVKTEREGGRGPKLWALRIQSLINSIKSIVSSKMKQPCSVLQAGYLDSILPKDFLCTAGRQAVFLLHCSLAAASITRYTGEPTGGPLKRLTPHSTNQTSQITITLSSGVYVVEFLQILLFRFPPLVLFQKIPRSVIYIFCNKNFK